MIFLSHIAIACQEIGSVVEKLKLLGLEVEKEKNVESEKVKVALLPVAISPSFRIEVVAPTTEDSPIRKFLMGKTGALHHLAFQVTHLETWKKKLEEAGLVIIPPGIRTAARGNALFLHPKSTSGVLIELEEIFDSTEKKR